MLASPGRPASAARTHAQSRGAGGGISRRNRCRQGRALADGWARSDLGDPPRIACRACTDRASSTRGWVPEEEYTQANAPSPSRMPGHCVRSSRWRADPPRPYHRGAAPSGCAESGVCVTMAGPRGNALTQHAMPNISPTEQPFQHTDRQGRDGFVERLHWSRESRLIVRMSRGARNIQDHGFRSSDAPQKKRVCDRFLSRRNTRYAPTIAGLTAT